MNILNCYIMEPDLDQIPESIWEHPEKLQTTCAYIPLVLNIYDEIGLELVRQLTDNSIKKTTLNVSGDPLKKEIQRLRALGFTENIQIYTETEEKWRGLFTYLKIRTPFPDVIIMGKCSSESSFGTTGYQVAEAFNIPCVQNVKDFEILSESTVKIISEMDDYVYEQVFNVPVLLMIGMNTELRLKVPTLREKLKYKNIYPEKIVLKEITEQSQSKTIKRMKNKLERTCTFLNLDQIEKSIDVREVIL